MLIVDAHQDIAYNATAWGRDYRLHPLSQREKEAGRGYPRPVLGLPDALLGRVAVVFASIFTAPDTGRPSRVPYDPPTYRDVRGAYAAGLKQMDVYQRLADEHPQVRILHTLADLEAVLATYAPDVPLAQRVQGLVIAFEGADPIIEPRQFEEWYERGVRVVGLAWGATRYAGGPGAPGRLTRLGQELLAVMADSRAMADLAHLSEEAFFDVLEVFPGTLICSHAVPRHFCDTDRHLSDRMLRALADRDGVMGVTLYNPFLSPRWSPRDPRSRVPLALAADVIDYVCQLTGSARHVGIGSDLDGGFGAEFAPDGIDTIADVGRIADLLRGRGYAEADIVAVMGGNFLRQLRLCLT
jgi:membrane dipeptidase